MTIPKKHERPQEAQLNRRNFLRVGVAATALCGAAGELTRAQSPAAATRAEGKSAKPEWRNKQAGMAYRQLGRTNLMISEVVSGGDPIKPDNYKQLELALDMGLNYLDMAPAYHDGDCERAYGALLAGSSAKREKVFLTTKISSFNGQVGRMYKEIFDGLPSEKKQVIMNRAQQLRAEREVLKPGYFLTYFPGQQGGFDLAYLRAAMLADYRHKVEGSAHCRQFITESLESSLKRVKTDYFDIVMCPHGANAPEDLQCDEIAETFQVLKKQGKVRFLGVTSHNDPAGVLRAAAGAGHYDLAMVAYNVINGGYLEDAIRGANARGMGVIAMKSAMAVATHHQQLQPVPEWRIQKVNRVVPGDLKPPLKAYLWSLQNPHISAVISNLWDENFVRENLSVAGQKVELQPA